MKYFLTIAIVLSSVFVCDVEAARHQFKPTASRKATIANQCSTGDSRCAYERKDKHTGTTMHFDMYGNLLGRTKP